MLDATSSKLTGTPGSYGWSQIHEFDPEDPKKKELRGKLFAIFATSRVENSDLDTIATGRELIARFHEAYYGDLALKPFNALRTALEKVVKEFGETWGEVQIAACSVVKDIVYSASTGGAEITISRKGILGTILRSSGQDIIQASGFPQKGDVMLLASKAFHENLPQGIIKASLEAGTPDNVVESFGPRIRELGGGSMAALVIKFDDEAKIVNLPVQTSFKRPDFKISELKNSAAKLFSKLSGKFPQKTIYVKDSLDEEVFSQSKKVTFTVAVILLAILSVSIVFGIRQKNIKDFRGKYQTLLTGAIQDVDEAISLASIAPDRSRELFFESETKLTQIEGMEVTDPEVVKLRNKIDEARAQILGEYDVAENLFLDLSLLASGMKSDSLIFSGGTSYVLDKTGKRIVSIELSTKKSSVVAGPNVIDEVYDYAAYEGRVFILSGDGIYELDGTKKKIIEKSWSGEVLIRAFGGNLYLLDKSANVIYRHPGQGNGFASPQSWLSSSVTADFSQARSWIIDGTVYVLYPNAKIGKYSLGSPQNFSVKNVVPEIGNIDAFFTSDENEFIYLLDNAGKRVVVIDKKGEYKAQYKNEIISGATGLVVSEKEKKLIVSVGDKLYWFEIKHF